MGGCCRESIRQHNTCAVCGDQQAGFFYGCLACTPCRTFFYRYTLRQLKFHGVCVNRNLQNCTITKETRKYCSYCRYQKCLCMGMSLPEPQQVNRPSGSGTQQITQPSVPTNTNQPTQQPRTIIHTPATANLINTRQRCSVDVHREFSRFIHRLLIPGMQATISYVQTIPAFMALCPTDKRTLLQPAMGCLFFLWMATTYDFVDAEPTSAFRNTNPLVQRVLDITNHVTTTQPTIPELQQLALIILFAADRPGLIHPGTVATSQVWCIHDLWAMIQANWQPRFPNPAQAFIELHNLHQKLILYGRWLQTYIVAIDDL